jgi:hypothetical protein
MTRASHLEIAISNLKGEIKREGYSRIVLSKEQAIDLLRRATGQDFGDDIAKWEEWVAEHGKAIEEERVRFGREIRERRARKTHRRK